MRVVCDLPQEFVDRVGTKNDGVGPCGHCHYFLLVVEDGRKEERRAMKDGRADGRTDGRTEGRKDGRTEERTGERKDDKR
jgi:hypothetical protein